MLDGRAKLEAQGSDNKKGSEFLKKNKVPPKKEIEKEPKENILTFRDMSHLSYFGGQQLKFGSTKMG